MFNALLLEGNYIGLLSDIRAIFARMHITLQNYGFLLIYMAQTPKKMIESALKHPFFQLLPSKDLIYWHQETVEDRIMLS